MKQRIDHDMFIREAGGGNSDQTLVWIHGLGESGLCFEDLIQEPALASFHHLVPDLPGYGRSPWPKRPLNMKETVDHLARWMEKATGPSIVIGHSLGGVLGLLLTEQYPHLVTKFIDVEGNKSINDCAFSKIAETVPFERFVKYTFPKLLDNVYRVGLNDCAFRGYYASLRLCHVPTWHKHARELVALSKTETLAKRLADALPPEKRCYIAGVPDGVCGRSLEMLEKAKVDIHRIEPAGHWPFLDHPQEFAEHLAQWITK